MDKPTEKQIRYLSHLIGFYLPSKVEVRDGKKADYKLMDFEAWAEKQDKFTVSNLIEACQDGDKQFIQGQLKHLGYELK